MKLIFHGISYKNCPVEIRERLSLNAEDQRELLRSVSLCKSVSEGLILNTCNRTEIYLYAKKDFNTQNFLDNLIMQIKPEVLDQWKQYSLKLEDIDVVEHLFTVAAGLDSQIIGENQIVNQLKNAYAFSIENNTSKFFFHRLLHKAFRTSKAVRTQTQINCGAVSISLAAVELAKSKMTVPGSSVLLVGAGESAALAAKYLIKAGISNLFITSRTIESAKQLAENLKTGRVISIDSIYDKLLDVDLLFCSTSSSNPVITAENCAHILSSREKPVVMIDIAVPRDIDSAVKLIPNVNLFNIDDLEDQIVANITKRENQIPKAAEIVQDHTNKFAAWLESLNTTDIIANLTKKYIKSAHKEAKRYAKDFVEADTEKLELFAESLAKKILHGPISYLKGSTEDELSSNLLQAKDLIDKMLISNDDPESIK